MKVRLTVAALAVAAFSAAPASAQLLNFPVTPVPMTSASPSNAVSAFYGRGLSDGSGEQNGFGVGFARAMEDFSFTAGAGIITTDPDATFTLGGQIGFPIADTETFDIGVQGGLAWAGFPGVNVLHVPVGVSFMAEMDMEDGMMLKPWFMPRFSFRRFDPDSPGAEANNEFDPGISGGASLALDSQWGIDAALDYLIQEGSDSVILGIGVSYVLGGGGGGMN